ncbi:MAG: cell wall metabolism sensor histidine kinase WalK, partial [Clostridiales bacterium]|nr:cell wall metabolism sensor histidine kinase WalK [Clostridiales bacterium]
MKKRLFTTYLILILIGTLTTGIFSLKLIITNYETGIKDRLITSGNLINSSLEKIQEDGEEFNYYKLSQDFAKQAEAAITFIDDTGQAVADSSDNSIIFVNQMDKPEVRGAVSGNIATSKRISNISKQNTLYIAMPPIELSGRKIVTRLAFPLADVSKLNELLLKSILTSIVIGIIFAISIGYWYVEKIASPIKRITAASKLISMGQLDKRVDISTKDEIEELANNFNNMASKLSIMITEINDNNVKLNAILTSMTDGILAIDNDNRIILLNPAIQRMLEIPSGDIIGKHLSEVLISSDLHDLISDTAENSKIQQIE